MFNVLLTKAMNLVINSKSEFAIQKTFIALNWAGKRENWTCLKDIVRGAIRLLN